MSYAVYQQGYTVFGVGETAAAACQDALQWLDEPLQVIYSDTGDGGWSLHAADASDEEIAEGSASPLATGYGEPTESDRIQAVRRLCERGRQGVDGDLILVECSDKLAERVSRLGGHQVVEFDSGGVLRLTNEHDHHPAGRPHMQRDHESYGPRWTKG